MVSLMKGKTDLETRSFLSWNSTIFKTTVSWQQIIQNIRKFTNKL